MNTKLRFVATLFAAGATAAIIAAPSAYAGPRTCADAGGSTRCENPGNVEIHTELEVQAPRVYGPFTSPVPFLFN
ncbi:MAG TPA: hypothetical protein VE666_17475 [Mycobacterium sp.]|jgi:hypothetical protein|nr:hypothetical protein [Mycobacterium sp.]